MTKTSKMDGARKPGERCDTPEQIAKCLLCEKAECNNCLDPNATRGGWGRKPVIAYREGAKELRFDSVDDAGKFFYCSGGNIRNAIYHHRMTQGYYWRYA